MIRAFRKDAEGETYTFARPCEHALLTSCSTRVPADFGIFIDTTDGTTATAVVGVRMNGSTTIIRDCLDIPSLGIFVDVSGGPNANITIKITDESPLQDDCGLCGRRNGSFVLPSGNLINPSDNSVIQRFISAYKVMPGDTFLMSDRRECGE